MKKLSLASLIITALTAHGTAVAAAPLIYDWTGFYAGLNAGGAWGQSDVVTQVLNSGSYFNAANLPAINNNGRTTLNPSGFTGGVQAGYNRQFGNWVFGFEADFEYFGASASRSLSTSYTVPPSSYTINQTVKTNWLFTARPRLGWASGSWLFYGTAGLAVTNLTYNNSFHDTFWPGTQNGSVSQTKAGWVIGLGVEHALMNSWSVKVEYLYVDFGSVSSAVPISVNSGKNTAPFANSANLTENTVRIGVNKKF